MSFVTCGIKCTQDEEGRSREARDLLFFILSKI